MAHRSVNEVGYRMKSLVYLTFVILGFKTDKQIKLCCFYINKLYFSRRQWDEQKMYELTIRMLTNLMRLLSIIL